MVTNVNNTGVVTQAQTTKPGTTTDAGFISDEPGATTGSTGDGVTVSIGSSGSAFTNGLTGSAANNSASGMATTTDQTTGGSSSGISGAITTNSADILTGAADTAVQTASTAKSDDSKTTDTKTTAKSIPGEAKQLMGADGKPVAGVFYKKTSDGQCEIIIKKEAGDVTVDQNLLKRIMGDNYDSNKVNVTLDQDNLKTGDKVGKVKITTDVGNVTVDNDNDYKEVGGDTNVAKADLTVEGQKDKLVLVQSVDVTTQGWNVKGDGKTQNVGSDLKYNISGCDVEISGHVTNKFSTDDTGAQGLMAGNKINVDTSNVGKVTDTTTMTNDFQVGKEIVQTGVPQTILDFLKEKGLSSKDIQYKDAKSLGIADSDVNHFAHGANGGTGLVVMKMGDGSWVVSGSGSPQTYHFTEKAVKSSGDGTKASSKAAVSDPFNEVNYTSSAVKADVTTDAKNSMVKPTIIDISGLKQQAMGSVFGIDSYTVRNSVNNSGGTQLEGSATQSIDVTGINYGLSKESGNFINGTANTTTGTIKEEHKEQFTGVADNLELNMAEALANGMTTDDTKKKETAATDATKTADGTNADGTNADGTTANAADGTAATAADGTAANAADGTTAAADGTATATTAATTKKATT